MENQPDSSLAPSANRQNGASVHHLVDLSSGGFGVVYRVQGGRRFAVRAAALGLTPGVQVTMLQNYGHGPLIISVRGTRLALGRGEALKIQIDIP